MEISDRLFQALGIPFSALSSVIFGLMILSFPIGMYVVFNSEIGSEINFDFPLPGLNLFPAGIGFELPVEFEIGDGFVVIWSIFLILFTIAMFGPKKNFLNVLFSLMASGKNFSDSNYFVTITKWFCILIVVSGAITFLQEMMGVSTEPPPQENLLIHFFQVSVSPITEELGFRVMLLGIPLFLIFSSKQSFSFFVKTLFHPQENLKIKKPWIIISLIIIVALFFGASHIFSENSWSEGKFLQATASGIILGWVYVRNGLIPAILIHWSTNFFIFSYVYFLADLNEISVKNSFENPLINTLEIILVITGIVSIALILINYFKSKKKIEYEN